MCAAIAAVMVQGNFQHIQNPADPSVKDTTNKFYESWVNRIDIEWLLQQRDLADGKPVISLLDSTIIDDIADYALVPGTATARPYLSKSLTLFLTLTNVRGAPFSLNGTAAGSVEEDIAYYADRLQFETVSGVGATTKSPSAKPLPVGSKRRGMALAQRSRKGDGSVSDLPCPAQDRPEVRRTTSNSPWEPLSVANPGPVRASLDAARRRHIYNAATSTAASPTTIRSNWRTTIWPSTIRWPQSTRQTGALRIPAQRIKPIAPCSRSRLFPPAISTIPNTTSTRTALCSACCRTFSPRSSRSRVSSASR